MARARALPEAERSADVRQWLRLHEELEAALAALPEVPASATPQRPLVEPLGGDAALAALLRFIVAASSGSALDPMHPKATLKRLAPQLPPFFCVWEPEGAGNQARAAADGALSLNACCLLCVPAFTAIGRRSLCRTSPLKSTPEEPLLWVQVVLAGQPALMEVLGRGGFKVDEADLEAVTRLMLAAYVSPRQPQELLP